MANHIAIHRTDYRRFVGFLFADMDGDGFVATWGCTISAGIISSILLQPIFSPKKTCSFPIVMATG